MRASGASAWIALARSSRICVLPALGGETMSPRVPRAMGAKRSMMRIVGLPLVAEVEPALGVDRQQLRERLAGAEGRGVEAADGRHRLQLRALLAGFARADDDGAVDQRVRAAPGLAARRRRWRWAGRSGRRCAGSRRRAAGIRRGRSRSRSCRSVRFRKLGRTGAARAPADPGPSRRAAASAAGAGVRGRAGPRRPGPRG